MGVFDDVLADIESLPSVIVPGVTPGHIGHSVLYKTIFEPLLGLTKQIEAEIDEALDPGDPPVLSRWDIGRNYIIDSDQNPFQPVLIGDRATVFLGSEEVDAYGTILGYASEVLVYGSAHQNNEVAAYFGVVRNGTADKPQGARSWLIDGGVHGPIGIQPEMLVGVSSFMNNYYNGSPGFSLAAAFAATAMWGTGPSAQGAGHDTADTYPVDVGYWAGGHSKAGDVYGPGFAVGFKSGGQAGGWNGYSNHSIIDVGFESRDYISYGIWCHTPNAGGSAFAARFDGPVILANLDDNGFLGAYEAGGDPIHILSMNAFDQIVLGAATNPITILGSQLGFFGGVGTAKPTITGSRGSNAALASLLDALEALGLLTDSTS